MMVLVLAAALGVTGAACTTNILHGVDERSAPELMGIVRDLSQRAGLPMPRVHVMDNPQPNAFAIRPTRPSR